MRILICGGRKCSITVAHNVKRLVASFPPETVVITGGCPTGVDTVARKAAHVARLATITVLPDWKRHGKAAGPIRNKRMLDFKPTQVVAFPGGRGTASMVKIAKAAGLVVAEIPA